MADWRELSDEYRKLQADGFNPLFPDNVRAWNHNEALKAHQMSLRAEEWNPNDLPTGRCGIIGTHDPHEARMVLVRGAGSELVWCRGHDDDH